MCMCRKLCYEINVAKLSTLHVKHQTLYTCTICITMVTKELSFKDDNHWTITAGGVQEEEKSKMISVQTISADV
jgi:dissimilatory sulfite reductase (desulfoviridin) alpha/beta subunit